MFIWLWLLHTTMPKNKKHKGYKETFDQGSLCFQEKKTSSFGVVEIYACTLIRLLIKTMIIIIIVVKGDILEKKNSAFF